MALIEPLSLSIKICTLLFLLVISIDKLKSDATDDIKSISCSVR